MRSDVDLNLEPLVILYTCRHHAHCLHQQCSGRHVDLNPVQRVPQPTRDVLVTRDHAGEREFSGFGAADNNEYADCFIDASKLPENTIKASQSCMKAPSCTLLLTWHLQLCCCGVVPCMHSWRVLTDGWVDLRVTKRHG